MNQRPPADRATPLPHEPLDAPAPISHRRVLGQAGPSLLTLPASAPANDIDMARPITKALLLSPAEERLVADLVDAFMAKVLAASDLR